MAWKYSNTTQINTDIALKKNEVICTILNFGFWSNTSMGHRFEHQDAKDNIFDQRFHKKNRMVSGLLFFPECKHGLEIQQYDSN